MKQLCNLLVLCSLLLQFTDNSQSRDNAKSLSLSAAQLSKLAKNVNPSDISKIHIGSEGLILTEPNKDSFVAMSMDVVDRNSLIIVMSHAQSPSDKERIKTDAAAVAKIAAYRINENIKSVNKWRLEKMSEANVDGASK